MPTFGQVQQPTTGDNYAMKDNIGHRLIIKPTEYRTGIVTVNSTAERPTVDGTVFDAVDLDAKGDDGNPLIVRGAITFSGATRDQLKAALDRGEILFAKIEQRKSKAGRDYPQLVGIEDTAMAVAYYSRFGDPFMPTMSAPAEPAQTNTAQTAAPAGDPDWMKD